MRVPAKKGTVLTDATKLNLGKTFECGQCFRWNEENGVWTGVALGRAASVWERNGNIYIDAEEDEVQKIWRAYFDLDFDYGAASESFGLRGDYLGACAAFGAGIRILRQDRWEALCSFILSQCNNIPRIKGIIERMCASFGEPMGHNGRTLYTFPSAEKLAALSPEDLEPLRCGYRAPYIIDAARKVAEGSLDLGRLAEQDAGTARRELMGISGVGEKVANCAVLFGLGRMEAFPVDVWMKRALKQHFPKDFDPASLGSYAGLAQQYIFFYSRSFKGLKP